MLALDLALALRLALTRLVLRRQKRGDGTLHEPARERVIHARLVQKHRVRPTFFTRCLDRNLPGLHARAMRTLQPEPSTEYARVIPAPQVVFALQVEVRGAARRNAFRGRSTINSLNRIGLRRTFRWRWMRGSEVHADIPHGQITLHVHLAVLIVKEIIPWEQARNVT